MQPKNTICLWFDKDAEEAARFYAATFPNSEVKSVHKAPGDFPGGKQADPLALEAWGIIFRTGDEQRADDRGRGRKQRAMACRHHGGRGREDRAVKSVPPFDDRVRQDAEDDHKEQHDDRKDQQVVDSIKEVNGEMRKVPHKVFA